MGIREFWREITSTRYVSALEAEVGRLRAENRALLNSILGIAGVPPIILPVAGLDSKISAQRTRGEGDPGLAGASSAGEALPSPGMQAVAPMRRRSWQQITRSLELESARKKDRAESDGVSGVVTRKV